MGTKIVHSRLKAQKRDIGHVFAKLLGRVFKLSDIRLE